MIRSIIRRARKAVKGQEAEAVRSTLRRMICAVLAACLFPALLQAQAEETRVYEEKIHHLADQMIKIDLDDGVKHNYEIFKDVLAKIK